MKKAALILMTVMVILESFAFVNSQENETTNQTSPYIDPVVLAAFEQNQTWVSVGVKYTGDIPITFENEQEMLLYYLNSSVAKSFFGYIPETEMKNIQGGLLALNPFFTAEITKDGLDELIKNYRVTKIDLNLGVMGFGNKTDQENRTLPSVDPAILTAFENQTWVRIDVILADNSNITIQGTKEERRNLSNQRDEWLRLIAGNVLSTLSENENNNSDEIVGAFSIDLTKEGLDKLSRDSRVSVITLAYNVPGYGANNVSATENQTQMKTPDVVKPQSFFQRIASFFKSLFGWK